MIMVQWLGRHAASAGFRCCLLLALPLWQEPSALRRPFVAAFTQESSQDAAAQDAAYVAHTVFGDEIEQLAMEAGLDLTGPLAAAVLFGDLAFEVISTGHGGCRAMDSMQLREMRKVLGIARAAESSFSDELNATLRKFEWEAHVLEKKMFTMTSENEEEFKEIPRGLEDYHEGSPASVCVKGMTYVADASMVFVHFIWGHLLAVFDAVHTAGLLDRRTKLIFQEKAFMCPRSRLLTFYGLFFDELPTYDPDCRGATHVVQLNEAVPIMAQFPTGDGEKFNFANYLLSKQETWEDHFRHCTHRVPLHRVLSARLRLEPPRSHRVVYLRRGWQGAVLRKDEVANDNSKRKRDLLNDEEVWASLRSLEPHAEVVAATFDSPWHEQVRLAGTASLLLGLHGSALASHEAWMPRGSILVNVMSPGICECRWSYCAATHARDFLYVVAITEGTDCHVGGAWLASEGRGAFEVRSVGLHAPLRGQRAGRWTRSRSAAAPRKP
eukprot:TRINITY_DN34029_c0_g1_i2.p1 TRINITY_DN34029_c0_g1~~TRINITY_DN34029_c0_g1_i2.p1  ORF type:complete len:496 (+),score=107.90 TRINITY_DN34029_c0_g1_i2:31-1518(+)